MEYNGYLPMAKLADTMDQIRTRALIWAEQRYLPGPEVFFLCVYCEVTEQKVVLVKD